MGSELATARIESLMDLYRPGSQDDNWTWREEMADMWGPVHRERTLELVDSIAVKGQLSPITLGSDGRVWDGHHRIAAMLALGFRAVFVTFSGGPNGE